MTHSPTDGLLLQAGNPRDRFSWKTNEPRKGGEEFGTRH